MKVIGYAEWGGAMEDILIKNKAIQEERKQHPDRYPKRVSDGYFIRSGKSFRIYEGTEEQFTNLAARWYPEAHWEFVVALDTMKVSETWQKLNK